MVGAGEHASHFSNGNDPFSDGDSKIICDSEINTRTSVQINNLTKQFCQVILTKTGFGMLA